jgi:hypothetical protein
MDGLGHDTIKWAEPVHDTIKWVEPGHDTFKSGHHTIKWAEPVHDTGRGSATTPPASGLAGPARRRAMPKL